ncbi:MAG: hypothetical protein Q4D04_11665, partial [Clostridia bacterium]|nr:hypothetical protein [Clostridia bacterium]
MKRYFSFALIAIFAVAAFCGLSPWQTLNGARAEAYAALAPNVLSPKNSEINPFVSDSESNIHNDSYNSDVTDAVLPLGIYPEVNMALEREAPNASPSILFDTLGHAVTPFFGGIAIRNINGDVTSTIGSFIPAQHDDGGYSIQVSYSFVDAQNHLICPTAQNHLLILKTMDDDNNVLPVFEKLMDVDIKSLAERALGKELTQNLLSVVFDYDGNLWFATGGFRIYPERGQTGVIGYISAETVAACLAGQTPDFSEGVFFYEPEPGEAAENGIASSKVGTVVLTNLACYMLRANGGVEVLWRTAYESVGAKGDERGGGLAWGGG